MTPTKEQLLEAIEHISFEMNRYLYTAKPICKLPEKYDQVVRESCLLHSRIIGDFFFGNPRKDDISISHYYDELISKDELRAEIEKSKSKWEDYKDRINKKLCHLTFSRNKANPMNMNEKDEINFDTLIRLFEDNLPQHFRKKWATGKLFSYNKA